MTMTVVFALAVAALALSAPLDDPDDADNVKCPYPSEDITWLSNPYNCSQYYECYEGEAFLMDCAEGLYWDQANLACDFPKEVGCKASAPPSTSTTPPTTTEETTTEPPTTTTEEPTSTTLPSPDILCLTADDGTYISNPEDCKGYFECIKGAPVPGQCPTGSLWNENILNCDFPQNVHCDL